MLSSLVIGECQQSIHVRIRPLITLWQYDSTNTVRGICIVTFFGFSQRERKCCRAAEVGESIHCFGTYWMPKKLKSRKSRCSVVTLGAYMQCDIVSEGACVRRVTRNTTIGALVKLCGVVRLWIWICAPVWWTRDENVENVPVCLDGLVVERKENKVMAERKNCRCFLKDRYCEGWIPCHHRYLVSF